MTATRVDIDQADVLDVLLHALRDGLGLRESHVIETTEPMAPAIPQGGDYWIAVTPEDSTFNADGEQFAGQCTEDWPVTITIYTRVKLDPAGREKMVLWGDARRSLFRLKKKVLDVLVGTDLENKPTQIPAQRREFLRELVKVRRCSKPIYDDRTNMQIGVLQLTFGLSWDWDLS